MRSIPPAGLVPSKPGFCFGERSRNATNDFARLFLIDFPTKREIMPLDRGPRVRILLA